jgi:LmbE family N-acetylglucosaminyl deacetylase
MGQSRRILGFDKVERVMGFGAHPDDEIFIGAVLHKLSQLGKEVYFTTFTCGGTAANSPEEMDAMIEARMSEMSKSEEILGIKNREILTYPSQELYNAVYGSNELHHTLIRLIREYRPDIIFTHYPDKHRDHNAIAIITPESVFQASESILGELGDPWTTEMLFYYPVELEIPAPEPIVEVSKKDVDAQIAALRTQESQERDGYLDCMEQKLRSRLMGWGLDPRLGVGCYAQPLATDSYKGPTIIG